MSSKCRVFNRSPLHLFGCNPAAVAAELLSVLSILGQMSFAHFGLSGRDSGSVANVVDSSGLFKKINK